MLNPPLFRVGNVPLMVLRRPAKVIGEDGRPTTPDPYYVQVNANVQPILKFSDTLLIPEGDRSKACLKVYTQGGEIRALKEGVEGWQADRFEWQGDWYEVMKSINYDMGVLSHYKIICMRVELT